MTHRLKRNRVDASLLFALLHCKPGCPDSGEVLPPSKALRTKAMARVPRFKRDRTVSAGAAAGRMVYNFCRVHGPDSHCSPALVTPFVLSVEKIS